MMNYAVVDLGSNTIRLSLYSAAPGGGFRLLFSEKETAGIAGYISGGVLAPEGIGKAAQVLLDFRALLENLGEKEMHVFATASLRNIRNTEEAVEQIRAATGVGEDVISGELEARLGYYGGPGRPRTCRTAPCSTLAAGSAEVLEVRAGGGPKRPRACPSDPWSCSIAAWTACGPRKRSWSGSAAPWPRP